MESPTYVVHLVGRRDSPFKHFRARAHARAFADEQLRIGEIEQAFIFRVGVGDPRAAIAAVKRGDAELADIRYSRASEEEIQRNTQRDWKIAVGRGPEAILTFLGFSTDAASLKER